MSAFVIAVAVPPAGMIVLMLAALGVALLVLAAPMIAFAAAGVVPGSLPMRLTPRVLVAKVEGRAGQPVISVLVLSGRIGVARMVVAASARVRVRLRQLMGIDVAVVVLVDAHRNRLIV